MTHHDNSFFAELYTELLRYYFQGCIGLLGVQLHVPLFMNNIEFSKKISFMNVRMIFQEKKGVPL